MDDSDRAQSEKAEQELRRQAKAMRELVETRAWATYVEVTESQIRARERIILDHPPGGAENPMERLLQLEQIKGARLGLKLALATPQQIIDDVRALSARKDGEPEEED